MSEWREVPEAKTETPTARLRFVRGRLQQEWEVQHFVQPSAWSIGLVFDRAEYEWRDVPTVDDDTLIRN